MLAVEGQASLTEEFFQYLDQSINTAVRTAVSEAMKELQTNLPQLQSTTSTQPAHPRPVCADITPEDQQKAAEALADRGLKLGLKDGQTMIDYKVLARLLDVSPRTIYSLVADAKVHQYIATGRIPLPIKLGLGGCPRWSVLELLEWVQAGCPRRTQWINQRGWSGWARDYSHHLSW
jgi:predicted DNA-binding transcriptional regulator AlpA